MLYFVTNCFHWVGYHLVNHLLENGYHVEGMDDISTNKKENLSMFLGRNDLFTLLANEEIREKYNTSAFNKQHSIQVFDKQRIINFEFNTIENQGNGITSIQLPLLFGEWMDMDESGMYHNKEYIPFDSKTFQDQGVYIEDFIKCFNQLINQAYLQPTIIMRSVKNKNNEDETLENSIYLRDNNPINKSLKNVINHYQKFKNYYKSKND